MEEYVEFFEGMVRVNIYLLIVSILFFIHFVFSYIFLCYKRGYKIDFWHFNIFIGYLIPFIILYPFASSDFNYISIGNKIFAIQNSVNTAYLITLVGYLSTYIGLYYHDFFYKKGLMYNTVSKLNSFLSRFMYFSIKSNISFRILYFTSLFLISIVIINIVGKYGINFNFRSYALADHSIRPLFNFVVITLVPIIITISIIRFYDNRNKYTVIGAIILISTMIMSGSRTAIFWPILNAIIIFLISKKRNISLILLSLFAFLFLSLVIYLGELRFGNISYIDSLSSFFSKVFYGNNFSDLRDFAWILTYWDKQFIYGKSYIAAFLSFIPRSISDFREAWAISVYTSNLVGLDPNIHAGLRPGKFGEVYLNFGIPGVIILGFITGYILRFTDIAVKKELKNTININYTKLYSLTTLYLLISNFYITSSFWKFYILIFIIIIGYFIQHILKRTRKEPKVVKCI
jgi:oligosaccharide repeat unit polymerase